MKMKACEEKLEHCCKKLLENHQSNDQRCEEKEEKVKGESEEEEYGVFIGFSWQKWRKFWALGSSKWKECVKKKERAKSAFYIELSVKDTQQYD